VVAVVAFVVGALVAAFHNSGRHYPVHARRGLVRQYLVPYAVESCCRNSPVEIITAMLQCERYSKRLKPTQLLELRQRANDKYLQSCPTCAREPAP
jgi:hypothetical protein